MSSLSNALHGLVDFLRRNGTAPPVQEMQIVEVSAVTGVDDRGRLRIRHDQLVAPGDYETRFDVLLRAGLPWVNVTCYGVHNGKLVIGIEMPERSHNPATRTSVNYSGPTQGALQNGWNVDSVLVFE